MVDVTPTMPAQLKWATPAPLAGVKSRKKNVFEFKPVQTGSRDEKSPESHLALTLESRISVVGPEARLAVAILLGEAIQQGIEGVEERHPSLNILHLCPAQLTAGDYVEAIPSAIAALRPHVIVLDEARDAKCGAWASAFGDVLICDALRSFKGAVVVCVERGSRALTRICSERWVMINGCVHQRPRLEVLENALDPQTFDHASALLEQVSSFESHDLKSWVDKARKGDWQVTLFSGVGRAGVVELCGFLCHHMVTQSGEFKIEFVFVPESLRGFGYGKHLVGWAIDRANQMPESECRWISLSAVPDKVTFYEDKFGFTDFGGDTEVKLTDGSSEKRVWMELKNDSKVIGAACAF